MSAHTPGPWGLDGNLIEGPDGERVACITAYSRRTPKQKANARLIAAAPDLLEALRGMMDAYMDLCDENEPNYRSYEFRQSKWEAARAAIAKVEGGAA